MPQSRESVRQPRRHNRSVDHGVAVAVGLAAGFVVVGLAVTAVAIAFANGTLGSTAAVTTSSAEPDASAARPKPAPVANTQPAAPPQAPPSADGSITVAAVGDMLFGRSTADLIASKGGAAPLANVAPLLSAADLTIGNLEGVISTAGTEAKWKDVRLRGDPRAVQGLQLAGFDAVALANNHSLDFGWVALEDTLRTLTAARVAGVGGGANESVAWRPVVVTRRGTNVALLSFTRVLPNGFRAEGSHPGVASAYEEARVVRAIRDAKKRYGRVVVSFHWGVEYADRPNAAQVELARHAVDAGADLVLGHHPHVIQRLESYHGKLIAYSLGDFVFEHYSAKTGEAFILSAEVGPKGVANVLVTPVYLDQQGTPSVVRGKVAQRILGRLERLCEEKGLRLRIAGDVGRVI